MNTDKFFTPLDQAIEEIRIRRKDKDLIAKVESFLEYDIPEHFKGENPILYLARHIATPSFETLRFIELSKPHGLPIVIGQDMKGKFVSTNPLKRALGKMSVVKGITRNDDEIFENFTIIDFNKSDGKSLNEIQTKFGENLVDFHVKLLKEVYPTGVLVVDESEWIDRKFREKLEEHYKHFYALLVVHGVMFEAYPEEESKFVEEVAEPAFNFILDHFGHKPLIVNLLDEKIYYERNWDSYPSIFYTFLKRQS